MKVELRKVSDIEPYQKNPRINDVAVEAVARSVRKRTPFLLAEPESKASRSLSVVAHRLARDGTIEASRAPQGFLTRLFQVYRKLGHKQK